MLRRLSALILFASALAWSQGAAPPGCANRPGSARANPDDAPKEKIGLKKRLKDQFSGGCANIFLTTCWGNQGNKPPANTPGAPESKDSGQTAPDKGQAAPADKPAHTAPDQTQVKPADKQSQPAAQEAAKKQPSDPLAFPEDESRRAQDSSQGASSSKQAPDLAFPEEQSRHAEEAAHGVESSSKQPYNPPLSGTSSDEMEVVEMKPYDPHKAEKDIEVGDFYYKRGNFKAASSRYQESLQLRPGSPSVTFKLADAFEKDKKLEQAAIYYSEYVRQYPKGPRIADARAALQRLAPVVQADAEHLKQVEIAHDLQAGEMLMAQKNYPDAVQRFCDVAGVAPDNARALFRLAQSLQASGEFAAAYQNYQGYLKLEPEGPFAPAAQREVQRLAPQVQQGQVTSPSAETRP
jgi:tetratricopeptide (TPR) repeat protein